MPQNALNMVDIDFRPSVREIADVLAELTNGKATNITEAANGGTNVENQATADHIGESLA